LPSLSINSKVGEFYHKTLVIPAQAGIQKAMSQKPWMPACAGMTPKNTPMTELIIISNC